jgi:flagellar motor switch protein FliM
MLSQAEIDALLNDIPGSVQTDELDAAPPRPYKTYDFRRPDKFSKDQLRTLQALHENAARSAAARLTARLRTSVSIVLATADQMVFDEYVSGLSLPTQLVVLDSTGLAGPLLLEIDLGFALSAVERMLGGHGTDRMERREPTAIEASLIERLIDDIVPNLEEAWVHLAAIPLRIVERAYGPSLLRVAAPSEVVAVLTYEVRFGGHTATISVAYPHASLEPMLTRLSATAWYAQSDRRSSRPDQRSSITRVLDQVSVTARAVLGAVEIPIEVLANLQPGDVIRFDERSDDPIGVWISDQVRSWGVPGRVGDRLALRLVSPLALVEA